MVNVKESGVIVDPVGKRIFKGHLFISSNKIVKIVEDENAPERYILPGFVDSHIHIESSLMSCEEFSKVCAIHGTIATISDPHEIANVCGITGIEYMLKSSENSLTKMFFSLPSCVPATTFETSGAIITSNELSPFYKNDKVVSLGEVMNIPGVLSGDIDLIKKIRDAVCNGRVVDGHGPNLLGNDLIGYVNAGVQTDHESSELYEAREKLEQGMLIQIRQGSAAKDLEKLAPLVQESSEKIMLCSDDLHPDDFLKGHINRTVSFLMEKGYEIFKILSSASVNPVKLYKLPVGLLQVGDFADYIVVDSLEPDFKVLKTVVDGKTVFENGEVLKDIKQPKLINNFNINQISKQDLSIYPKKDTIRVITVKDGELLTGEIHSKIDGLGDNIVSDIENDILKIVVLNRYNKAPASIGFVKGFQLKKGAYATSVAHDSHNIIAVGVDDNVICKAINCVIDSKGGMSYYDEENCFTMTLPIGGLMSDKNYKTVVHEYEELLKVSKSSGCKLSSPFMTLSFLSLLVIPKLKIGDRGLFDYSKFDFTELFV
ncbi:MAG: adenine deaminase [Candidatus Delongbacteria bacterium]|nr:adenine deaminase [Candidatus Delongbacteria bacterium]MBN2834022.1 adenine deaminase [Candidatus Delongbacteria bacterium]